MIITVPVHVDLCKSKITWHQRTKSQVSMSRQASGLLLAGTNPSKAHVAARLSLAGLYAVTFLVILLGTCTSV